MTLNAKTRKRVSATLVFVVLVFVGDWDPSWVTRSKDLPYECDMVDYHVPLIGKHCTITKAVRLV